MVSPKLISNPEIPRLGGQLERDLDGLLFLLAQQSRLIR